MRSFLFALLLTLGSFAAHGQAPDCQFTQTFTATGYGVTTSNQAVSNLGTQCTTWRLSYYADGMTALSIQIEGAPDASGSPGTFAAVPATACSSTQQPPCLLDGTNPLTDINHNTEAFRGYYAWIALDVTVFTRSGASGMITARMYGYKGTSPSAGNRGGTGYLLSGSSDPATPVVGVVQHTHCQNTTCAFATNVTATDLLIAVGAENTNFSNPVTISDTMGNIWKQGAFGSSGGGFPNQVALCYATAKSTGATTVTINSAETVMLAEFNGNTTATVDDSNGGSAVPTLNASQASDLLISALITGTLSGVSVSGSEVLLENYAYGHQYGLSWIQEPSAGSITTTLAPIVAGATAWASVAFKTVAVSSPGGNGDWYLNLTSGALWGPKAGGIWSPTGFILTP